MSIELNVVKVKVNNEVELGYVIGNMGRLSLFNALGEMISNDICNGGLSFTKRADIFLTPKIGSIMERATVLSIGFQARDEVINLIPEKKGIVSTIRPAICTYENVRIPCILVLSYEYGTDILKYGAEISDMFSIDGRRVSKSFYEGTGKDFIINKRISDTFLESMRYTMQYIQGN